MTTKPRQILTAIALLLTTPVVASSLAQTADDASTNKRPNILFIMADDHAWQALAAYESYLSEVARTPNLDQLAAEGMLFERCLVTNSICGPVRAVIQTGKHSHMNGFWRNGDQFDAINQDTFPKLLQQVGYQTAVIGKWHLGEHQAPQGYDYSEVLIGQGPYYNPVMLKDADGTGDVNKRTEERHHGYVTDIITDLTLEWLENGWDRSQPFMLMSQHKAPHREWSPEPGIWEDWRDVAIPEPPTLFEDHSQKVAPRAFQQMTLAEHFRRGYDDKTRNFAPGNLTEEQRTAYRAMFAGQNEEFEASLPHLSEEDRIRWIHQRYVRTFLACVESIDRNVGRVLQYLEENGLAENTIVIYTSDQGFFLGEHGWYDKRWAYEESMRTPLIVRWPGRTEPGSRNPELVSPLDFAQTFLDIAGAEQPDDMQGRSLVPLLEGETPGDWRRSHYYHYYEFPGYHAVNRHYAVSTKRYKLIRFYQTGGNGETGVDAWELIDLVADPHETINFYDDPGYAEVREKLHAELERLRTHYQVPEQDPERLDRGRNQF